MRAWWRGVLASRPGGSLAFSIDTDGELAATGEPGLFERYGLDYQPGAGGERRLARR